jgi:hypothetical protein
MAAGGDDRRGKGKGPARKRDKPESKPEIPRKETIVGEKSLVTPKGGRYTIVETNQTDPYDDEKPNGDGDRSEKR